MSILGGYFSSEWSFSWYKGLECPAICCFGADNKSVIGMQLFVITFLAFTADGTYEKIMFDPKKGGEVCVAFSSA